MLTIDGKQYRNLEEQVEKNKNDIISIINEQGTLNQFGIKVIGQVEYLNDLPTPAEYEQSNPNFEYGDAYAVGIQAPYSLYILTRANANKPNDYWFNIGQFPMPGPEGKAGESADITVESTTTTLPGSLARVENTGDKTHAKLQFYIPAGKKGDQGITPTVNIGTVSSGSYANVTNSGTTTDVILDFVLPKGESIKGDKGDPGDIPMDKINEVLDQAIADGRIKNYDDTEVRGLIENVSNKLVSTGSGDKFLSDDGTYKLISIITDIALASTTNILSAKTTIDELNKKIATADIVNNCTSDSTTTPLAASQGKYLQTLMMNVINDVNNTLTTVDSALKNANNALTNANNALSALEKSKVDKIAILSTVSDNPSDEKLLSEKYISGKITEIENKVSVIPSTEPATKVVGSFWLV